MSESRQCPKCHHHQVIGPGDHKRSTTWIPDVGDKRGFAVFLLLDRCTNKECREVTVMVHLYRADVERDHVGVELTAENITGLTATQLWPYNTGIFIPAYVPDGIRADYEEACAISGLSPKAAATLARRCIQGMIRDFQGITKTSLYDEISALQGKIDPDLWNAIDGIRKVGNIGAHMEKDIGVIIDVEPEEATTLIGLIELLIKEWYIAREKRKQSIRAVTELAAKKDAQKQAGKSASTTKPPQSGQSTP